MRSAELLRPTLSSSRELTPSSNSSEGPPVESFLLTENLASSTLRVFDEPVEIFHYGYRTVNGCGVATNFKEIFEKFEAALRRGSEYGEWKSFKSLKEATEWAYGKDSLSVNSKADSDKISIITSQDFERKTKIKESGTAFGYTTLYSNDEKWSTSPNMDSPSWGNQKSLIVDADGACPKNGRRGALGGIGVYFGPNDSRNVSEPLPGHPQTNQRAELMSLIRAVEILRSEGKSSIPICLRSDSRYAVSGLTEWVPKWKRNGWTTARGTEVKNQDLWRTLDAEIANLGALRKVHLIWVKAHAGDRRNEEADRLATEGVRKAENIRQRLAVQSFQPQAAPAFSLPNSGVHRLRLQTSGHSAPVPAYFAPEKKPSHMGGMATAQRKIVNSSFFSFDKKQTTHAPSLSSGAVPGMRRQIW